MNHIPNTFFRAFIALTALLAVVTGPTFAKDAKNSVLAESVLRGYVDQRWLYGNSEQMLSALNHLIYQIPVNGIQLSIGRKFSKGENDQVVSDFNAHTRKFGVEPLTKTDAQRQFVQWSDCLVKGYQSGLSTSEMEKLQTYIDAGIFQVFPRLGRLVEGWDFIAMQRVSGLIKDSSQVIPDGDMPNRTEDQRKLELVYLSVADPIQNLYMGQFINQSQMSSVRDELLSMSMDLPAASISLGVSASAWTSIESYAMSNLPSKEQALYRACRNNPQYVTKAMASWSSGAFAELPSFFDSKMKALGKK